MYGSSCNLMVQSTKVVGCGTLQPAAVESMVSMQYVVMHCATDLVDLPAISA